MERWSDRPAPELNDDLIDKLVILSTELFKNHSSQIAKFAPPIVGFALFLRYFHTHHFYPSFDLLQFSSLLLGAGMVGFAIIGTLWLWLLAPGLWIFHGFIEKQDIRQSIKASFPAHESKRIGHVFLLVFLCFVGPYSLCSVMLASVLIFFPSLYLIALLGLSLLIALLFGIAIQFVFKLPKYSFFRYAFNAWAAVLIVNAMAFTLIADTKNFIDDLNGDHLKILAIYLIPLGACLTAAICAMGSFGGLRYAAHFSLLFALIIAFYSGILAGLPDRTMKSLGLGNYQAESIVLEPQYCSETTPENLPLTPDCSLTDVHVVWSLGETLTLILGSNNDARQVQIPSRFLKTIIRQE